MKQGWRWVRRLMTVWVLGLCWGLTAAQAQCVARINNEAPGAATVTFDYQPGLQVPLQLSVSCAGSADPVRYSVELLAPAAALPLTLGTYGLSYSVMTPSPVGCSSLPLTAPYTDPTEFNSLTPQEWQTPLCLRLNTLTARPANGLYAGTFTLMVSRCRVKNRNCAKDNGSDALVVVTLAVQVPLSCTVAQAQSLALNYVAGQPQAAVAQGEACVLCNEGFLPSNITVTPGAAVQLGLQYTLTRTVGGAATAACAGIRVQVQAVMPGQQWGRCHTGQCRSSAVHQLIVHH